MLFDTTFLIDYEREVKRNRPAAAHAFLAAHPTAPLDISIISAGEFAEGFEASQQQDCWRCLRLYTVLPLDLDIVWRAAQVARQLRVTGQTVGDNDLWIGATALHHQLALVTNNPRHFQGIPGLQLVTY
ncbi:MAG TPA: type II toxin-antitoxin system VapC family toxin [Verrucomicrobiae bacterium]